MHLGLIAVKADVKQLVEAFPLIWKQFELKSTATLGGIEQFQSWQKGNERSVPANNWSKANPGVEVFGFWQDGPWAIMLDPSYVQASDENGLAGLSERFGLALSFVVETNGGCAYFWCFEQGGLRRSIQYADGELVKSGEPLDAESGLPADSFYMDETEELQKRFGITPPWQLPEAHPCEGVAMIDRTDYSALLAARGISEPRSADRQFPPLTPKSEKPWWKFW